MEPTGQAIACPAGPCDGLLAFTDAEVCMHALVFIKQVPQQNSVKLGPDKKIDASGIEPIISLFDEYAIEEALLQVEKAGGAVTVATIGGEQDKESLRKA